MNSSVSSTTSITAVDAKTSITRIAALNSQANALRQQLLRSKTLGAPEAEAAKSEDITREIVNVQSEIEKLILEAQLSRLSLTNAKNSDPTDSKSDENRKDPTKSGHGDAHGNKQAEAYKANTEPPGKLVDVQA
jgi:capsule polysaccharide export protein KpsE/RkpR